MMGEELFKYLPELGVLGALVVSAWLWAYQREQRMAKRLDLLEDYIRNEQAEMIRNNQDALSENTAAFRQMIAMSTELSRKLNDLNTSIEKCNNGDGAGGR
jgi:hypothetical protein